MSRFKLLVNEKALWSVELEKNQEYVGSAVLCERSMTCGGVEPFKVSFYSQIYIEPKYRGQGYLRLLMDEMFSIECNLKSIASIVIARKAVGNLYTKFGYKGFSKFPTVTFSKKEKYLSLNKFVDCDLSKLQKSHRSTYRNQNGYFARSQFFWREILSSLPINTINLKCFELDGDFWYYIASGGEVIELGSENQNLWSEIVKTMIESGLDKFSISETHPAFKVLINLNGVFSVRPEPDQGHMMRINKLPSPRGKFTRIEKQLQKSVAEMNLNILLLDQW
jgi:hypothetical protein